MATRWMIAFEGFKQIHTLLSTQLVPCVRGNRFASVGLFIERKKNQIQIQELRIVKCCLHL